MIQITSSIADWLSANKTWLLPWLFPGIGSTVAVFMIPLSLMKQALRASITAQHIIYKRLGGTGAIIWSQKLHTPEEVADIEAETKSSVWIYLITTRFEMDRLYLNVISKNIRERKAYTYFLCKKRIPNYRREIDTLLEGLRWIGVPEAYLHQYLRIFVRVSDSPMLNITMIDPETVYKRAFLLPVYTEGLKDAFQVDLDQEYLPWLEEQMSHWSQSATQIFPPTDKDG